MALKIRYCHTILFILGLALVCCEAVQKKGSGPKQPVPGGLDVFKGQRLHVHEIVNPDEKVFNVLDFGAFRDGETPKNFTYDPELYDSPEDAPKPENSQFFKDAWLAACHHKGKARILIPDGNFTLGPMIFPGPCTADKPLILQVVGTLKASTDMSEFTEPYWLSFEQIDNFVFFGRGRFDGQGAEAWTNSDCKSNTDCQPLPSSLKFKRVSNGIMRGITSMDPKGTHIFITESSNFRVQGSKLTAPEDSPNTDGIHISNSNNIKISKTYISTGDDCIGMIKGCTNISINKVKCGPGHGISIGSLGKYEGEEDVRGISVKNCTFSKTTNGIRIKTWPGGITQSQATDMLFDDLVMEDVANPIIIDQGYCPIAGKCGDKAPSLVKISNIHYSNIQGTSSTDVAVTMECSQKFPCEKIKLNNINLIYRGEKPGSISAKCHNAKVIYNGIQNPTPACQII